MKLLADFRSRVLSAKVKKAAEENDEEVMPDQEEVTGPALPSSSTVTEKITADEDW